MEDKSSYLIENQDAEFKITSVPVFPENPEAFIHK